MAGWDTPDMSAAAEKDCAQRAERTRETRGPRVTGPSALRGQVVLLDFEFWKDP